MNQQLYLEVRELYHELTCLLIKRNVSVSTMESCTSGLIATLLTDTEGASAIMPGALVAYCNEQKIRNGVSEQVIKEYSVYSPQAAEQMALASSVKFGTEMGIGVTGCFANTDPSNPEGVPGTVYCAICLGKMLRSASMQVSPAISRQDGKMTVAKRVAEEAISILEEADN